MRILTIHNRYKFRGGEDEVYDAEHSLLAANGHDVRQIVFDNAEVNAGNLLKVGLRTTWSGASYTRVRDSIRLWRPDVVNVHNFFPLASPSIHYAARNMGVPVVQNLHNYRILCPGGNFYRDGAACEDCTRHIVPWPAMVHGCYRGSTLQTGAVAVMSTAHKLLRTWTRTVALFFVMSEFAKQKFVENGLLVSRMLVKRNFVVDPGAPGAGGEAFLYAGRLSREKGTHVLLNAIALTRSPDAKFLIVGDGPLESGVREAALRDPRITFYGRLPLHDVMRMMASARAVIVPSDCYETFGRVAAEALAVGTPVICTDGGAVTEVVENTKTGFHFRQSDPADLARIIDAAGTGAGPLEAMRGAARIAYEAKYTPEIGYQLLLRGFRTAIRAPCESGSDLTIAPRR